MNKQSLAFVKKIFSNYPSQTLARGEILLSAGDQPNQFYFLRSGEVSQYFMSEAGEEIIIHQYITPTIIPLMIVLSGKVNNFYFESSSDIEISTAPIDEVLPIIMNNGIFTSDLSTRFAKAIYGLSTRISSNTTAKQKQQLLDLLQYLAEKKGTVVNGNYELPSDLTHVKLASWLGCARETVTRLIKELISEKHIALSGKHIVVLTD